MCFYLCECSISSVVLAYNSVSIFFCLCVDFINRLSLAIINEIGINDKRGLSY